MTFNAKPTGSRLPFELRWRIAILTALAVTVPILRNGGALRPDPQAAVAAATVSSAGKGWGMAGMLPGVSPITLGHTLHAPSDRQS